jgi:hypothetical protein
VGNTVVRWIDILPARRGRRKRAFFFGLNPGYWLRVQLAYDLSAAINTVGTKIEASVHPHKSA